MSGTSEGLILKLRTELAWARWLQEYLPDSVPTLSTLVLPPPQSFAL